jgi:hypothetical protein|tara:strand:- start:369 stop:488 length:120 start_codon:yes stop_codon:yes gene_type:complete
MRTLVAKLDKPRKKRRGVHSKNASKSQVGYKKEYRGQGK